MTSSFEILGFLSLERQALAVPATERCCNDGKVIVERIHLDTCGMVPSTVGMQKLLATITAVVCILARQTDTEYTPGATAASHTYILI